MGNQLVDVGDLDQQIEQALAPLNARQRKFVEIYAAGDNATSAALKAGYSVDRARQTGCRLATNGDFAHVQRAIALLRDRYSLQHGIPAAWKRGALVNTYERAMDINQPGSAVSAVRVLCELDGDIRTSGGAVPGNVTIVVQTGIQREKDISECPLPESGSDFEEITE